jgi:5-methylcytosine-specific restriction endonuclease McrA
VNKKDREVIFYKFGGLCAYTGKPLGDDWEIDHIIPKSYAHWFNSDVMKKELKTNLKSVNDIENLVPAIKIINHYKRGQTLEGFREYIKTLHLRLAKLPKNPKSEKCVNHKKYLLSVAELFDITKDNPWCGEFYFETLEKMNSRWEEKEFKDLFELILKHAKLIEESSKFIKQPYCVIPYNKEIYEIIKRGNYKITFLGETK